MRKSLLKLVVTIDQRKNLKRRAYQITQHENMALDQILNMDLQGLDYDFYEYGEMKFIDFLDHSFEFIVRKFDHPSKKFNRDSLLV